MKTPVSANTGKYILRAFSPPHMTMTENSSQNNLTVTLFMVPTYSRLIWHVVNNSSFLIAKNLQKKDFLFYLQEIINV